MKDKINHKGVEETKTKIISTSAANKNNTTETEYIKSLDLPKRDIK